MKNAKKTSESIRHLDQVISKLSENELLSIEAMSFVRGGEGEANGGESVPILPPKPPQP